MTSVQDIIRAANAARQYTAAVRQAQNRVTTNVRAGNAARKVATAVRSSPSYSPPAPKASAPKQTYSAPSRASTGSSNSGGGYSGGGGAAGGGGYSGGFEAAAAPVQAPVEIPDPMADATYQKQTGELARAMADFKAQQDLAKSQYDTQYGMGLRRMGWDQQEGNRSGFGENVLGKGGGWSRALPGAYGQAYNSNENDFAGRGLYNSGLYTKAVSDMNADFTDRKNTMDTARTDWQATQDQSLKNLEGSQESTRQGALSEAIARIAAQYGVNLGDVTPGRTNQVMR